MTGDDRDVTEAIAQPEAEFWTLIETVPDDPADDDFSRVAQGIVREGIEGVLAFQARLTLALYDLDGRANHAWFVEHDPMHFGFVSEDVFLYARCATVLAGREIWARAVVDQTLEWRDASLHESGASEMLLGVAPSAAEALGVTNEAWFELAFTRIPISYETGSNAARWTRLATSAGG
jgi:hypothetical protein